MTIICLPGDNGPNVFWKAITSHFCETIKFTGDVTRDVRREIIRITKLRMTPKIRKELMAELGLKLQDHFREEYLLPALKTGMIALTIPDKPRSRLQKYRLTEKGSYLLSSSQKGRGK